MLDTTEAIIFDMDGESSKAKAIGTRSRALFSKKFLILGPQELQKSILGMSVYDVHQLLKEEHGLSLSQEEFLSYYNSLAEPNFMENKRN